MISWIKIWIRINLQMTSQNVWSTCLFVQFFKVLSLYLEARIRIRINMKGKIRIRIKMTSRIRIHFNVMRIRNTVYKIHTFTDFKGPRTEIRNGKKIAA